MDDDIDVPEGQSEFCVTVPTPSFNVQEDIYFYRYGESHFESGQRPIKFDRAEDAAWFSRSRSS